MGFPILACVISCPSASSNDAGLPRFAGGGLLEHIECDVDDHVLLAADHLAAAQLDQERTGVETVIGRSLLSVAEEARIDPGIAERQRFAVDAHRAALQRPHQLHRGVHTLPHIYTALPALDFYRDNDTFERHVPRS